MININNIYLFFIPLSILSLLYIYFNYRPYKTNLNNKILLKNLLEGLDLDLPDELKSIDNSSTDPQKLS